MSNVPSRRARAAAVASLLLLAQAAVLLTVAPLAGATPHVASKAEYRDLDADGRIDAVTLTFSGGIFEASIRPSDFRITCTKDLTGCPTEKVEIVPYDVADDMGAPNDNQFTLLFQEHLALRSDAVPDLTYKPGSLMGDFPPLNAAGPEDKPIGEIVAGSSPAVANPPEYKKGLTETDKAPPVFWGATSVPGKKEVILSFSEPVQPVAGGQFQLSGPTQNFHYDDVSGDGINHLSASTVFPAPPASRIRLLVERLGDVGVSYTPGELDATPDDHDVISATGLRDVAGNEMGLATALDASFLASSNGDPALDVCPGATNCASLPVDQPRLRSFDAALGGRGSDKVTLHFNAPVTGKAKAALVPGNFQVVASAPAGAVSNVVAVDHADGSDVAILTLNARLNCRDLGTASNPPVCSSGTASGASIQISSADAVWGPSGGPSGNDAFKLVVPVKHTIVDTEAPRIVDVRSLDVNLDGQLDAIQVTFSEDVLDPADMVGDAGDWVVTQPGKRAIFDPEAIPIEFTPNLLYTGVDSGLSTAADCAADPSVTAASFPSSIANDRILFLCIADAPGESKVEPLDPEGGTTGLLSLGTPSYCATPPCKVSYLPGSYVAVTYLGTTIVDHAFPPTPSSFLTTTENVVAVDGARPVLMSAKTQDNTKNGFLDGYALRLSEPIVDATAAAADFEVMGRAVALINSVVGDVDFDGDGCTDEMGVPGLQSPCLPDLDGNGHKDINIGRDDVTPAGANDEFLLLGVKEQDTSVLENADTGETPDLVTRAGCCKLTDAAGNKLAPVIAGNDVTDPANVEELDRARPQILRVHGVVGFSNLDLLFSEPVFAVSGAGCSGTDGDTLPDLCPATMAYANHFPSTPSAISNMVHGSASTDKPHRATVSLNGPLAKGDFDKDQVSPAGAVTPTCADCSRIAEQPDPPAAPYPRRVSSAWHPEGLSVPVKLTSIGQAPDTSPPATVLDMEVIEEALTDSRFTVKWTAPGDDGTSSGTAPTVSGYEVVVTTGNEAITETTFDSLKLEPGRCTFQPTFAAPGAEQLMTCTKLEASKTYLVSVRGFDDGAPAGSKVNYGTPSPALSIQTLEDEIPPGDVKSITLFPDATSGVQSNQVTVQWIVPDDNRESPKGIPAMSYIVKASQTSFTAAGAKSAAAAPVVVYSSTANAPGLVKEVGQVQVATIKGLAPSTTYYIAVWAVDTQGLEGAPILMPPQMTTPPDLVKPGPIGTINADPGVDSVTFTWTAPGDDGASGSRVQGYEARIIEGSNPIAAVAFAGTDNAGGAIIPLNPAIAEPGAVQTFIVSGLKADTPYSFAVRAIDEVPNAGDIGTKTTRTLPAGTTGFVDKTPPGPVTITRVTAGPEPGQLVVEWLAPANNGTEAATGRVSAYIITIDGQPRSPDYGSGILAGPGETQRVTFSGLPAGKTVSGRIEAKDAAGNLGPAELFTGTVGGDVGQAPTVPMTVLDVERANLDLQNALRVTDTLSGDLLVWIAPNAPGSHDPIGYQVWCVGETDAQLIQDLGADKREFLHSGECAGGYVVTAVYENDLGRASSFDAAPGSAALRENRRPPEALTTAPDEFSTLTIVAMAVAGAFVVLSLVLLVITLRRREQAQQQMAWPGEPQADGMAENVALPGADASAEQALEAGLGESALAEVAPPTTEEQEPTVPDNAPVYDVTCPKCQAAFMAQGEKPLQIQCPSCGVKGILR